MLDAKDTFHRDAHRGLLERLAHGRINDALTRLNTPAGQVPSLSMPALMHEQKLVPAPHDDHREEPSWDRPTRHPRENTPTHGPWATWMFHANV
jgi:hypothetical protein